MRVALNARHLRSDRLEGIGMVTEEVMRRIVASHPDDQFHYFFDRRSDPRFHHGPNVKAHDVFPPTRLPVLIRYWLNHPVRSKIHKDGADVFFSPDGFIPLGLAVPKVSMVHDAAFLRHPELLPTHIRKFYDTWMPRYLAYTDHIITVSQFSKQELIAGYGIHPDKISVVYNGVSGVYRPATEEQKQETRRFYTEGEPYFLYLGALHPRKNILTLVKAYEAWRKAGTGSHKLVIAGRPSWHTDELETAIRQSPYQKDIRLTGYIPEDQAIRYMAAAEALIYPSVYEGFGLPVLEAMSCGVPVICSNASALPEVAGDAALVFDLMDMQQLTQHMETIVSDMSLRNQLIQKGLERRKLFSWDRAAKEIYEILATHALSR